VADVEEADVVPIVAAPTAGALEFVVPGVLDDVAGPLPLPVEVVVELDWSRAVTGSVVLVLVLVLVVDDDVPLVAPVESSEPSGVVVPSVVDVTSELPGSPVVVDVVDGDCAAGSVMWPTGTRR
jgi:hypothetical protein